MNYMRIRELFVSKKSILLIMVIAIFITNFSFAVFAEDTDYKKQAEEFTKLRPEESTSNTEKQEGISFDFPNTELVVFARFVVNACGKILVGEDLLKGNVNIKSEKNLSLKELKDVFSAMLFSYGLEFVETEECMEIVQVSDSYVKVYNLKHLKAADLAKALSDMFRMSFRVGNNPVNIQITAVEGSNALMVLAPKNQHIEIEECIKEIDVEARQVFLDILVVELTQNSSFGFGINATYNAPDFKPVDTSVSPNVAGDVTGVISGTLSSSGTPAPDISYDYSNGNWTVNVNSGNKNTDLKVLSQPRVIAVENQKSEIKISKKQPYANGTTSVQNGDSNSNSTTTTTATEDVGVDITITPRINSEKDVTLELKLKITSIVDSAQMAVGLDATGNTTTQPVPVIGHRIVNNTSVVKNKKVLVIGGLLDNQKTTEKTAPPVLGDIPWLGFMFAKTTEVAVQTQLMIYITPIVIDSVEALRMLTKNQIEKMRNYDSSEKNTIDQMLTGKKTDNDDTFNLYKYFSDNKYREKQDFIVQPENL